jgi:hypothetical protein
MLLLLCKQSVVHTGPGLPLESWITHPVNCHPFPADAACHQDVVFSREPKGRRAGSNAARRARHRHNREEEEEEAMVDEKNNG